jgi:hypothetical protein
VLQRKFSFFSIFWLKVKRVENAGGSKPNLADLALFGVLWPIQHLQTGKDMTAQIRAQKS